MTARSLAGFSQLLSLVAGKKGGGELGEEETLQGGGGCTELIGQQLLRKLSQRSKTEEGEGEETPPPELRSICGGKNFAVVAGGPRRTQADFMSLCWGSRGGRSIGGESLKRCAAVSNLSPRAVSTDSVG